LKRSWIPWQPPRLDLLAAANEPQRRAAQMAMKEPRRSMVGGVEVQDVPAWKEAEVCVEAGCVWGGMGSVWMVWCRVGGGVVWCVVCVYLSKYEVCMYVCVGWGESNCWNGLGCGCFGVDLLCV
jgi:hypothetical protein